MRAVDNVALSVGSKTSSCGAAGVGSNGCAAVVGGIVVVGDVSTDGVEKALTEGVGTGCCCCTSPNPTMSSGMASSPNTSGKPQWVVALGWGGGTGCRVKNVPSVGVDGSFGTIGRLLIKVGGAAASGYSGR